MTDLATSDMISLFESAQPLHHATYVKGSCSGEDLHPLRDGLLALNAGLLPARVQRPDPLVVLVAEYSVRAVSLVGVIHDVRLSHKGKHRMITVHRHPPQDIHARLTAATALPTVLVQPGVWQVVNCGRGL